jgi:multidrug efflux pump
VTFVARRDPIRMEVPAGAWTLLSSRLVPRMLATRAGAEMRQSLGTAVFFGMLGVTFFGLLFTPVFYVACRRLALLRRRAPEAGSPAPASG